MTQSRPLPRLLLLLFALGITQFLTAQCVVTTISSPQATGEIINITDDNEDLLNAIQIVPSAVPAGTNYGYLITDASYTILEVITSGSPLDLSAYAGSTSPIVVWGFNYTGNVLATPGMSAFGMLSDGCFNISINCIMITFNGDGGGGGGGGPCLAAAGSTGTPDSDEEFEADSSAYLEGFAAGGQVVPAGYSIVYVLTMGPDLTIVDANTTGQFVVDLAGNYRVHVLVAQISNPSAPDYLNLGIINFGVTTAADVLALIDMGGICASLDATGAPITVGGGGGGGTDPCIAEAGTTTASSATVNLDANGQGFINVVPDGNQVVPTGYEVVYLLARDPNFTIVDFNSTGSFVVTQPGTYFVHLVVLEASDPSDPNYVDLNAIDLVNTTAADLLALLSGICFDVDLAGSKITVDAPNTDPCIAAAGTSTAADNDVDLDANGSATISATANGDAVIPAGYSLAYVLTSDPNVTILDFNATGSFTVSAAGNYTIHTLVAQITDPTGDDYLDLNLIDPGTTTASDLLAAVGSAICFDLDVNGANITVNANGGGGDPCAGLVEAGTISTALDTDGDSTITLTTVGDGQPDMVAFSVTGNNTSASFTYVVTDDQGNILGIPPANMVDFEGAGPGTCIVYGVSYTGTLNLMMGGTFDPNGTLSSACFDVSNAITVIRNNDDGGIDCDGVVEAGTVFTPVDTDNDGSITINTVGDGQPDMVTFGVTGDNGSANTVLIVTDDQGNILGIPPGNMVNFEPAGPGTCRVYSLNYTGTLLASMGDNIANLTFSDECFDLSDAWITVIRNDDGLGGGPCTAEAGTVTATSSTADLPAGGGSVTISATPNGNQVVPAGYNLFYVLTQAPNGVIRQTSTQPSFNVSQTGTYRIHPLVVQSSNPNGPNYFPLSNITLNVTTAAQALAALSNVCADLDANGAQITVGVGAPTCGAFAGTTSPVDQFVELNAAGQATIQAIANGNQVVPPGFQLYYVLTAAQPAVILQINQTGVFTVDNFANYNIRTLVATPAYANDILLGGGDSFFTIDADFSGPNAICGDIENVGSDITVVPNNFGDCNAQAGTIDVTTPTVTLTSDGNPGIISATNTGITVIPPGFDQFFILTYDEQGDGVLTNDVIVDISTTPTFQVTQAGTYRIFPAVAEAGFLNAANFGLLGIQSIGDLFTFLTVTGDICADLNISGGDISVVNPDPNCTAEAATTFTSMPTVSLGANGEADITATASSSVVLPPGFELFFALTRDPNFTVVDIDRNEDGDNVANFTVDAPGTFTIHAVVAEIDQPGDPNFVDLNLVNTEADAQPGADDVNDLIILFGTSGVCFSIDLAGTDITVNPSMASGAFDTDITLFTSSNTTGQVGAYEVNGAGNIDANLFPAAGTDSDGLFYDCTNEVLFQVNRSGNTVVSYSGFDGASVPSQVGTSPAGFFTNGRGLTYSAGRLVVADDAAPSNGDVNRFIIYTTSPDGSSINFSRSYVSTINLWGLQAVGETLFAIEDNSNRLAIFQDFFGNANGSAVAPDQLVTVESLVRTHGLFYQADLDMMFLTDIGDAGSDSDGAFIRIPQFTAAIADGTITDAEQIRVEGAGTFLGNPVDIAYDPASMQVFIAERANGGGRILAFNLPTADGPAAPTYNDNTYDGASAVWFAGCGQAVNNDPCPPGVNPVAGTIDFGSTNPTFIQDQNGNVTLNFTLNGNVQPMNYNTAFIVTQGANLTIVDGGLTNPLTLPGLFANGPLAPGQYNLHAAVLPNSLAASLVIAVQNGEITTGAEAVAFLQANNICGDLNLNGTPFTIDDDPCPPGIMPMAGTVVFASANQTFTTANDGSVTLTFDVTGNNEDAINAALPGTNDDFNTGYIVTDANGMVVTGGLDNGVGGPTTNETIDFPQFGQPNLMPGQYNLHTVLVPNNEAAGLFLAVQNGTITDAASAQAYLDANDICGDFQANGTSFMIAAGPCAQGVNPMAPTISFATTNPTFTPDANGDVTLNFTLTGGNQPMNFNTVYVITTGAGFQIVGGDITNPVVAALGAGQYRLHAAVLPIAEAQNLLDAVANGTITDAASAQAFLMANNICNDLDLTGTPFQVGGPDPCAQAGVNPVAGTISFATPNPTFTPDGNGQVTLNFTLTGNSQPANYNTAYIVTQGTGLMIVTGSTTNPAIFTLADGSYNLHAVVLPINQAAPLLAAVGNGTINDAASAQAYLQANNICGDLNLNGTPFTVGSGAGGPCPSGVNPVAGTVNFATTPAVFAQDLNGDVTIDFTLTGNTQPVGFNTAYIVTQGPNFDIVNGDINNPLILALGTGAYRLHAAVLPVNQAQTLLAAVANGTITDAASAQAFLTSNNICSDLNLTGTEFTVAGLDPCLQAGAAPMAGTISFNGGSTFQTNMNGQVSIPFTLTGNNEPSGFTTAYVITTGANQTIVTGSLSNPVIATLSPGTYRLHAVVLPNTEATNLFLAVGNGTITDAASAQAYLNANNICGDLNVTGTEFSVTAAGNQPLMGSGTGGGVFPNPVLDYITVDMYELGIRAAQYERVTVRLIAPDGRIVDARRVLVETGRETVRMDMMHLQGGIYQVQVLQRGAITTRRVTKL